MKKTLTAILTFVAASTASTALAAEPPITAVAFAPSGKTLVAASQRGLRIYGWPQLKPIRTIKVTMANLHCIAFSPTGKLLAVGGGDPAESGSVEILSWPAMKSITRLPGHEDSVRSIAWIDASSLVTASIDRSIKLWRLTNKKAVRTLRGHSRSVDFICLLKDAKTLVSTGVDQSLRVWDVKSGKLLRSLNQHTKPVHRLALRPYQNGLAMVASAAGDRTVRLWQPTIGRMVRYVRLKSEPLDIVWLKKGARIAASCVDGQVRLIDPVEVKVLQTQPAIQGWAYAMAAHPNDGSLAVGGAGGRLRRIVFSDSSGS